MVQSSLPRMVFPSLPPVVYKHRHNIGIAMDTANGVYTGGELRSAFFRIFSACFPKSQDKNPNILINFGAFGVLFLGPPCI